MITLIVSVNGVLRTTQRDYTNSVCEWGDLPPNMITLIMSMKGVLTPAQRDYTDSVCEWGVETRPT